MGARSAESGGAGHGKGRAMNRRKFLLGSAAALTGSGLLVGTQGSSQVESHRTVRVQVENDSNAYLLLEYLKGSVTIEEADCSAWAPLLLVGNQTKERLDEITVELVDSLDGVSIADVEFCYQGSGSCFSDEDEEEYGYDGGTFTLPPLSQGEQVLVRVDIACEDTTGGETIRFDIEAAGEDTGILAHRAEQGIAVTCECGVEGSAWAYGGNTKPGDADPIACDGGDNPFWKAAKPNKILGSCTRQWGWFVTADQTPATLYARADGNDLSNATAVGKVYAFSGTNDCSGDDQLYVNYIFNDRVAEVVETNFDVVADPQDLVSDTQGSGDLVPPSQLGEQGLDGCVDISDIPEDDWVLAAHAEVTLIGDSNE